MKVLLVLTAVLGVAYIWNMEVEIQNMEEKANATVIVHVLPGMTLEDQVGQWGETDE